jgi:hypothetical protein
LTLLRSRRKVLKIGLARLFLHPTKAVLLGYSFSTGKYLPHVITQKAGVFSSTAAITSDLSSYVAYNIALHYVVADTALRAVVSDVYIKLGYTSFWRWAAIRNVRKIAKNGY